VSEDERSCALHGIHCISTTKLVSEVTEITSATDLFDIITQIRLSVIKQQLNVKMNGMDKEIVSHINLEAIANKLVELEGFAAKIISCIEKIEERLTEAAPVVSVHMILILPATLPSSTGTTQ